MYTKDTQLKEQIAIVEKLIFRNSISNESLLIPDNNAELFIPLDQDLEIKIIGSTRSMVMTKGRGYFLSPRRRGMEVISASKYLLIKINPIYSRNFTKNLNEIFNGGYEMRLEPYLVEELLDAYTMEDRYKASDSLSVFLDDYEDAFNYNNTILESIDRIRHTGGTISVKEIYSSLNVSKSKLEQHFNKEIGLTPKEFCKIEKINSFIDTYKSSKNQSLTELTYLCGYYDQSHLIKDFRYFLNTSPKRFFTAIGI